MKSQETLSSKKEDVIAFARRMSLGSSASFDVSVNSIPLHTIQTALATPNGVADAAAYESKQPSPEMKAPPTKHEEQEQQLQQPQSSVKVSNLLLLDGRQRVPSVKDHLYSSTNPFSNKRVFLNMSTTRKSPVQNQATAATSNLHDATPSPQSILNRELQLFTPQTQHKKRQINDFLVASSRVAVNLDILERRFGERKVDTVSSFERDSALFRQSFDSLLETLKTQRDIALSSAQHALTSTIDSLTLRQNELHAYLVEIEQLSNDVRTNSPSIIARMALTPFDEIISKYNTRVAEVLCHSQAISLQSFTPNTALASHMQTLIDLHGIASKPFNSVKAHSTAVAAEQEQYATAARITPSLNDSTFTQQQQLSTAKTLSKHQPNKLFSAESWRQQRLTDRKTQNNLIRSEHILKEYFSGYDLPKRESWSSERGAAAGTPLNNTFDASHATIRLRSQSVNECYQNENIDITNRLLRDDIIQQRNTFRKSRNTPPLSSIDWTNSIINEPLTYHSSSIEMSVPRLQPQSSSFSDSRVERNIDTTRYKPQLINQKVQSNTTPLGSVDANKYTAFKKSAGQLEFKDLQPECILLP